jgi:oligopeptide/dipeptide ABC transporter ATP-binding protein
MVFPMHSIPALSSDTLLPGEEKRPLLAVEDLHVHFQSGDGIIRAVNGVDFTVGARETLGLVGESGSGKTITSLALLRLVPRPAKIVRGRIVFENSDLMTLAEREMQTVRGKRIAMVFQNPAYSLNPILSIGDQLSEVYAWHEKVTRRAAMERVAELLNLVGITDPSTRLRQFPHELSGGMKQRVCIARALICNPTLVLADEPTTNLDVTIQSQILYLLDSLKKAFGTSMVLVTHDMGVVARMADRIAVMYAGRMCETADARVIFRNPQHPYTRALLESLPRIDRRYGGTREDRLPMIKGRPPNLAAPPTGCPFHPRCAEAEDACRQFVPQMTSVGPGHTVSCLKRGSAGAPPQ